MEKKVAADEEKNNNFNKNTSKEKLLYPHYDMNMVIRSCEKEVPEPLAGTITGNVPEWLNGALLRNGPGSFKVGEDEIQHVFDGAALVHKFLIKNGVVTYQCKFLKTDSYKKNMEANRIVLNGFGTVATPDPCQSIFQRISSIFDFSARDVTDNTNVSLYPFGDELYALTETPYIHRINPDTLETDKKIKISDYVAIVNHTAHPHVTEDGTVFNVGMCVTKRKPCYAIVCFPAKSKGDPENSSMFDKAQIVASVPARWPFYPAYMHSFGITENYFIIIEQPLNISVPAMMTAKLLKKTLDSCLRWYNNEQTLIHLINRKTGDVEKTFYSDTFFFFHIINQYEHNGHVVIDICCFKDGSLLNFLYLNSIKNMQTNPDYGRVFKPRPLRFVLPLNLPESKTTEQNLVTLPNTKAEAYLQDNDQILVKPEQLVDYGCELPTVYYDKFSGKMYRYFYCFTMDYDRGTSPMLMKVDTHNKTSVSWHEIDCYPSEPIFVPSPNAQGEDDGVVLASLVWSEPRENRVALLILDAKTFTEIARVDFKTPSTVPKCIHGWFLPNRL